MEEKKSKLLGEKCPYWALENIQECGMSKGGMYIPMPEHVKMFCLSSNYSQCRQYIRGCDLIMSQDKCENDEFIGSRDRRRLRRFPEHLYLDLIVCDRNENPEIIKAYKAKSLDVSLGGVRIESYKQFAPDTVISFVLDPDFSSDDDLLGIGEVKWCEPVKDSNKFESGLAFTNYSTSQSIREFLRL